jgi:hypothetical protein
MPTSSRSLKYTNTGDLGLATSLEAHAIHTTWSTSATIAASVDGTRVLLAATFSSAVLWTCQQLQYLGGTWQQHVLRCSNTWTHVLKGSNVTYAIRVPVSTQVQSRRCVGGGHHASHIQQCSWLTGQTSSYPILSSAAERNAATHQRRRLHRPITQEDGGSWGRTACCLSALYHHCTEYAGHPQHKHNVDTTKPELAGGSSTSVLERVSGAE